MYIPDALDAHNEFAVSEELQTALWKTVQAGDRTINLQHSSRRAGEWVECVTWPYAVDATLMLPSADGAVSKRAVTLPAGTPYMGVLWEEWAYDLVKKGHLRGYSMEGAAHRVEVEFDQ